MTSNIQQLIDTNIKVLGVIDLYTVDYSCNLIMDELLKYKKDHYLPNEKIVILHNDTEYFYYNNKLGFTTHNLFSCWRELDIPYHVMVMYTNHSTLADGIQPFIVHKGDCPTIIPTIVNNFSWQAISLIPSFEIDKKIEHPAMCLLGLSRNHRTKIFQYLTKNNLFNLVKTNFNSSYHNSNIVGKDRPENRSIHSLGSTGGIYTIPHRNNESCFLQSTYPEIVDLNFYPAVPRLDPALTCSADQFYNKFFLDVVAETVFDYPHVFISEKILKPLLFKTPFIVFGAEGTLRYLHRHGFKTFNEFWDESYDNESDPHLRFLKCCYIMHNIVSKPLDELRSIYSNMLDILEHNRSRLLDYVETEYKPLYNKINL